jgi:hypothetical protein
MPWEMPPRRKSRRDADAATHLVAVPGREMDDAVTRVLLLVLLVTAAGFIPAAVSYARREPPLAGRGVPAGLRLASLALVLLLLVNPAIPGTDPVLAPVGAVGHWIVVEQHPVLGARAAEGEGTVGDSLRTVIQARVEGAEPPGSVALLEVAAPGAEGAPEGVLEPPPAETLAGTLLRLAEAGADSLEVHTPLRGALEPLEAAIRTLSELPRPVPVRIHPVATGLRNAGIAALELPDALPPDEALEGTVVVGGEGASPEGDSARVRVRVGEAGTLALDRWIRLPAVGERARIPFTADLPGTADLEVVAEIELAGDAYAADDRMRRVLSRDPGAGGILLLSFVPDGEPRVLLPLLERATGLEGRGWLRVGEDRFVALGGPGEPLRFAAAGELGREIPRARFVLIQGSGGTRGEGALPPAWTAALEAHPRRVLLVGAATVDDVTAAGAGWSVDPGLPASPLSGYLSGILGPGSARGLPPLGRPAAPVTPGTSGPAGVVALRVREPGGSTLPAVILSEGATGREVQVLVPGLWRWALREGEGERFYRGLWGGVAAWVLAPPAPGARPDARSDARPGDLDPVAPGSLLPAPPGELEGVAGAGADAGPRAGRRGDPRRPLRTHPLPWLLLVGLLSAEWLLRRRIGLR